MNKIIKIIRQILGLKTKEIDKERKRVKVKHSQPLLKQIIEKFNINEQILTAFVILAILLFLFFLYMSYGTWSVAKFIGGISQKDSIELPGKKLD